MRVTVFGSVQLAASPHRPLKRCCPHLLSEVVATRRDPRGATWRRETAPAGPGIPAFAAWQLRALICSRLARGPPGALWESEASEGMWSGPSAFGFRKSRALKPRGPCWRSESRRSCISSMECMFGPVLWSWPSTCGFTEDLCWARQS